jgi:hypothetical protein
VIAVTFRFLLTCVFLVVCCLTSRAAEACAVCGAADKTLAMRGEESAFRGRLRATMDGRAAAFVARDTALRVTEVRLVPGAAVAVNEDLLLSLEVPLLRRTVSDSQFTERYMLGDVEGRASFVAYRTSSRRLSFHGGVKGPTAPIERDANGAPIATDLQPGCGAIVPLVGATYTISSSIFTAWMTGSFLMPFSVREGPHPGDSLRVSSTMQIQPVKAFAARVGVHGRLDGAGDIDDRIDKRSGGASVFIAPELVASPVNDLVVSVGAAFPLVQETRGHRVTAPIALVGIGYDF